MLKSIAKYAVMAGSIAMATTAFADGMPRGGSIKDAPIAAAPAFNWTGFYIGAHAGYAWGKSRQNSTFTCSDPATGCPFNVPANLALFNTSGTGVFSADGYIAGGHLGYNVQSGAMVVGFEADFSALDILGTRSVTGGSTVGPFTLSHGVAADWMMTFRGRIGALLNSTTLLYFTAGLAVADLEVSNAFNDRGLVPAAAGSSRNNSTELGLAIGGGMEIALTQNWMIRGEYLYLDFDAIRTTALVNNVPNVGNANNIFSTSGDLTAHIGRFGLSYKF